MIAAKGSVEVAGEFPTVGVENFSRPKFCRCGPLLLNRTSQQSGGTPCWCSVWQPCHLFFDGLPAVLAYQLRCGLFAEADGDEFLLKLGVCHRWPVYSFISWFRFNTGLNFRLIGWCENLTVAGLLF